MASTTPPDRPPPPPPPPSGASREEWREWRRTTRRYYRRGWGWAPFWGIVLIVVGGYYLLKDLGYLYWVQADVLWPILLIALGVWIVVQRMSSGD